MVVLLVTVFTDNVNVFDVNVVVPLVPDMDITPDAVEFVVGVNVAVYVVPVPEIVPNVPPVQFTYDEVNKLVEAFNVNVMVAVCPVVRLDLSLVIVPVMVVLVTVFTVRVNVFDVNVVDPFVPEVVITPDVVEFGVGVNVAV